MKRTVKLSILSIAVISAISANASNSYRADKDAVIDGNYTIDEPHLLLNFTDKTQGLVGIYAPGYTTSFTGGKINLNIDSRQREYKSISIYSANATTRLNLGTSASEVIINSYSDNFSSAIMAQSSSNVALNGSDIKIHAESTNDEARALEISGGAIVNIGSDLTQNVNISAQGNDTSMGLFALQGGQINIKSKDVTITTNGYYALLAQNNTETSEAPDGSSKITINADNTSISATGADGAGIMAFSNGQVEINGNLTVNAPTAIDTRGNATININQNGGGTVVLNGDIVFETPGPSNNSGNVINSYVNINLEGSNSSWTGALVKLYPTDNKGNPDYTTVKGFKLNLSDGAKWNATEYKGSTHDGGTLEAQAVNNLTLDGGVINSSSPSQTIAVENLTVTENGGKFNSATVQGQDGQFSTAKLDVETVSSSQDGTMTVTYTGITSDQINGENSSSLNAITNDDVSKREVVQEGNIKGTWTRDENGENFSKNAKLTDYGALNSMTFVQWRNEINHLTKRLGDIRASESSIGAWARVYGGESQWKSNSEIEMDHTTIQVGADYRINNHWIVGGAFSYTDSDADLVKGQAKGDSYSLAAYATYMADGGSYLDLIARYGYLDNELTSGNMNVDTQSNAFSLSVETGHMFRIMEQAYIEPQIEVTYGFISGDDATASNGVRLNQDDFQSLITRVGVRTGFEFPEKAGTIYAMLSYSYDFLGDADGTASQGGLREALNEDLGGGWVSYGIGAQFKLGDNAFAYGELERTSGGEIDNQYLFNVGFRWNF